MTEFERAVTPLFDAYCFSCHDGDDPDGGLSLATLDRKFGGRDNETWRMIYERVKYGEMPPADAEKPHAETRDRLLNTIRNELLKTQQPGHVVEDERKLPRYGNHVDHAALFADTSGPVIPGPPRVWRVRPAIYREVIAGKAHNQRSHNLSDPLSLTNRNEIKDYAGCYFIGEASTGLLLANAERIVKLRSQSVLQLLSASGRKVVDDDLAMGIRQTYQLILRRQPTAEESLRLMRLYREIAAISGRQLAAERMLMAIYMQPDALFREELGEGPPDEYGRIRLSQREIATALSYALGNRPDSVLFDAAAKGELVTRSQIANHIQRRFDSPPDEGNPRILQFFQEYFGYQQARKVFKNQPLQGIHLPEVLTTDLDTLIDHIVDQDIEVLRNLLTTSEYFVDCKRDPQTGILRQSSIDIDYQDKLVAARNPEYATVYGLPRDWFWTDDQPIEFRRGMRVGVLTHPAWLAAWSGNFDNHPVQRGRWIRTHLLGGSVPDVPINVDAKVPQDRSLQFRTRLTMATADAACQRCHKKMDLLGMPFEQYDHYGGFRHQELRKPVDTSGKIAYVDDDSLTGDVAGVTEMMHRLANSTYVEQVFVRYAFRYFMGRNETLGDANTLQDAHQAYRESGGSFRTLVKILLTSDSFLYRFAPMTSRGS